MAKRASKKNKPARSRTDSKKAPAGRAKSVRERPLPTKDAPWDVDLSDDGDFASPRIDLDENEIKEREDRRG